MMRMDVVFNGEEFTFRTNNSGEYLFTGVAENRQISCEAGFNSLRIIKAEIRRYLRAYWEFDLGNFYKKMPRIAYRPYRLTNWKE